MSDKIIESKHNESGGLKITGLVEETKRMAHESKGSPKVAHDSSIKASTRVAGGKYSMLDYPISLTSLSYPSYR
jgi:hypothetical protein